MKQKFSSFDIKILVKYLTKKLAGFRVINIYNINNKTFLIKLSKEEEKQILLLESGIRLHTTAFQWPKEMMPSGFAMKLRKHLKGRRLEYVRQVGDDRVIDMQFGSSEAAYHIILELYDRGNIALTDYQYTILNILRPRTNNEVKLLVGETYGIDSFSQRPTMLSEEKVTEMLTNRKPAEKLKNVLGSLLAYGPQLVEHGLIKVGLRGNVSIKDLNDVGKVVEGLRVAEEVYNGQDNKGYIIQICEAKKEKEDPDSSPPLFYSEFHPVLYEQHSHLHWLQFDSFDQAIDEFFSKVELHKQEKSVHKMEETAMRKLQLIRTDHCKRIDALSKEQLQDRVKARLIEMNLMKVEEGMAMVRGALARQMDWQALKNALEEAKKAPDAPSPLLDIKELKFEVNQICMLLKPEYMEDDDDDEKEDEEGGGDEEDEVEAALKATVVNIDLSLSAYANACKYYDKKKMAALKESKTTEASAKALKSAERKNYKILKEARSVNIINKARKTHWFEKFLWFISSENYMVIGGRDKQQNELIVKKYLKLGDVYVHADLHGASSVVIKNPSNKPVSPVTLNEAGNMALCYSAAWEAKVVTTCWWVHHHQVSKTAPSGEYLTTGSFMIRGKKNYLLPSLLVYGFGVLFKVDPSCVANHENERRIKGVVDGDVVDKEELEDDEEGDDEGSGKGGGGKEMEMIKGEGDFVIGGDPMKKPLKNKNPPPQNVAADEFEFPDTKIDYSSVAVKKVNGVNKIEEESESQKPSKNQPLKRGQKGKLKKIKEKYKDQDEEEREIRMSLLNSAGKKKKDKSAKKVKNGKKNNQRKIEIPTKKNVLSGEVKNETNISAEVQKDLGVEKTVRFHGDVKGAAEEVPHEEVDDDEDDADEEAKDEDSKTAESLDSFTGLPVKKDILLYCLPVCAPYSTLNNYKYKIKMIPGNFKRGKATKTFLSIFLADKSITPEEKQHIKSLKDVDSSRNMPGKIKAPHIKKK